MKHPIGYTRNNKLVYVDLIRSKAAAHISEQPYLLGLVKEALSVTKAQDTDITIDHDTGRAVGYSPIVKTSENDVVWYAKLLRDNVYTRFIKNGKQISTRYLTLVMRRDQDGEYELLDTWIGRVHPPRPGSQEETDQSKAYWDCHAYVFDKQSLQTNTITKTCPY